MCYIWVIEINIEIVNNLCVDNLKRYLRYVFLTPVTVFLLEKELSDMQYLDEKIYFLTVLNNAQTFTAMGYLVTSGGDGFSCKRKCIEFFWSLFDSLK